MNERALRHSAYRCGRFAHYAYFACLPLITTLIIAGDFTCDLWEELNPTRPRWWEERWEDAVKDLNFEGHKLFTYDNYNLFFCLGLSCRLVTEARFEADRHELAIEAKNPLHIVKSHTESLLKAIEF